MDSAHKWDTILEFLQTLTFTGCSITTWVILGFDCNTAYFFLMTSNKLTDLSNKTSTTLGKPMIQFFFYLLMSIYAICLALAGTCGIDKDADKVDTFIYQIQAAQYLFLGFHAYFRENGVKDYKEKIVSITTDFFTCTLFAYEYYRDQGDLEVLYNGGPEKELQKVMIISYTVSNLIFILNSLVEFINAFTTEYMLTSNMNSIFCTG